MNLIAPICQTGYGVVGHNTLRNLLDNGWDVSLFPIGKIDGALQHAKEYHELAAKSQYSFNPDDPCLRIWHQHDLHFRVGRGRYFAWPIFELDRFTPIEQHQLESADHLIVCSEWAKEVIEGNDIKTPVSVVPLGVDTSLFKPTEVRQDCPTIFINVGKWEVRKGHDSLVNIFNKAFTKDHAVELWLIPHNPFYSKEDAANWERLYLDSPLGSKIKIWPWQKTQKDLVSIMSMAHCGIFPQHAEGWNLEALELLAMGKQLIITDYSGSTQFATPENSTLIKPSGMESAYDGVWFFDQGQWASIDEDAYVEAMRNVYDRHLDGHLQINQEGIDAGNMFSWENSTEILADVLTYGENRV